MTRLAFCLVSIGLLAASVHPRAQQPAQQRTVPRQAAPQQQAKAYSSLDLQLSRGITLYATDDDSGEAESLFVKIIGSKPATTREGETALYYLGRYYHRNYYMLRQKPLLDRAVNLYKQLHLRVDGAKRPSTWYAEARLYKGLAYLEMGDWENAFEAVDHIDPKLDDSVDIDYLVWSYDKRQLNRRVPTQVLKDEYLRILTAQGVQKRRKGADRATFDTIVRELEGALGRKALSRAN
jgi:tetratricopeptide (TPR) repeat protein